MISRRQTREYLLQSLYARAYSSSFDRDIFYASFFEGEHAISLDTHYLDTMESLIIQNESKLFGIIELLAPKFEAETLPTLHILILMISLTEMLYWSDEAIPPSVSVNEAVELAKKFSDSQGKGFINGALSTFLSEKEKTVLAAKESNHHLFA